MTLEGNTWGLEGKVDLIAQFKKKNVWYSLKTLEISTSGELRW